MMTPMERLRATARGEPTDRVPVFCNLLEQGARELGVSVKEYYADGALVAAGQLRLREKFGQDNVWGLFFIAKEAELFGCREILFAEDGPPNVGDLVIKRPEDIDRLVVPDILAHPAFREPLRCMEILRRKVGGKVPICVHVSASLTLPSLLMGMEAWLRMLLMGPFDLRDRLISKCSEFCRRAQAAYRAAGADLIFYANPFSSTDLVPYKLVEQLALRWMQRDLEPGGTSGIVYFGAGARLVPVLPLVLDKLTPDACFLGPFDDVGEAKRCIAGRSLCVSAFNDLLLIDWSAERIRGEVARIMDQGRPGGRFCFGTMIMPLAIPEKNIHIMVDTALELAAGTEARPWRADNSGSSAAAGEMRPQVTAGSALPRQPATITGMDRLAAVTRGELRDRVPVFCNLIDQGARELGVSLKDYYADGERVATGQLRMRERFGYDNLWCLFYVGREAELVGCRDIFFAEDGPPTVAGWVVKSLEDIDRLRIPEDVTAHPAFREPRRCIELLRREAGGRYPICAYVTSSMALPAMLMGMEQWMRLLLLGPFDRRDRLLTKCSELCRQELAAYRALGVDAIVDSSPFGSADLLPTRLFRQLALPWMVRDLGPGGTQGIVDYGGSARLNTVIPEVLEKIGIGIYYLSPLDDIAEAKRLIAGRALCVGTINDIQLVDWPRERIRHEVKRIMDEGRRGGHFFFGTVVCPWSIPEANLRAMLEAAYEFGGAGP